MCKDTKRTITKLSRLFCFICVYCHLHKLFTYMLYRYYQILWETRWNSCNEFTCENPAFDRSQKTLILSFRHFWRFVIKLKHVWEFWCRNTTKSQWPWKFRHPESGPIGKAAHMKTKILLRVEVWIHTTGWITPRFIEVPIQVNTMSTSGNIVDIGTWFVFKMFWVFYLSKLEK